jgi:hypothetical protein
MATDISEFKNLVAVDVLPCPDPIVNREVVSVLLDFCKKSNILTHEFELDVNTNDIDSTMQNSIDFDISAYSTNLRPVTLLELMVGSTQYIPHQRDIRNTISNFSMVKDENYKYFWIVDEDTIRLFDMSTADSILWMRIAFKPLRTATTVDDALFEDWSEAIVAGAKWKILTMPGKDWSDPKTGDFYRREYRRYLSQAKQKTLKGGSGQSEKVNWQSFGDID